MRRFEFKLGGATDKPVPVADGVIPAPPSVAITTTPPFQPLGFRRLALPATTPQPPVEPANGGQNSPLAAASEFPVHQRGMVSFSTAMARRPVKRPAPVPDPVPAPTLSIPSSALVAKKPRKAKTGNDLAASAFRPKTLAADRWRVWASPYSVECENKFRSAFPEHLVNKSYAVLSLSLAPASQSSYGAGLLRFHQFCDANAIPEIDRMPASAELLTTFIANHAGTIQGGTIKAWMSGLKAWHSFHRAPWCGDDKWVELARRSANKMSSKSKNTPRGPVTIEHLVALRAALNLSSPFDAAVWAIATAAFWGCRRLGELTIPSLNAFDPTFHVARNAPITRVQPTSSTPGTSIHIPWTKSTREKGGSVVLTDRDDELCPEKARLNHLAVNANTPEDGPMFAFVVGSDSWSPMTKTNFIARCADIWKKASLLAVSGHSFRIGGSTELLLAGVPCEVVAATGGWTSLAFLLYWRKLVHIIPLNIGKAYNKDKLAEVAAAFERFRIDSHITIIEETED